MFLMPMLFLGIRASGTVATLRHLLPEQFRHSLAFAASVAIIVSLYRNLIPLWRFLSIAIISQVSLSGWLVLSMR